MMPMEIEVSETDIAEGKRNSAFVCPVALAICRAKHIEPGDQRVVVEEPFIEVDGEEIYHTPLEVFNFIRKFDKGDIVEPFKFTLGSPWIPNDNPYYSF